MNKIILFSIAHFTCVSLNYQAQGVIDVTQSMVCVFTDHLSTAFGSVRTQTEDTGSIEVTISDIKSDQGKVILMLFNQAEGFPSKKEKAFKRAKLAARKGKIFYTFKDLPYGTYSLSVVHDENDNDDIDTNFIGLPKERIGASYHKKLGRPTFEKSKFTISETQRVVVIDMGFVN